MLPRNKKYFIVLRIHWHRIISSKLFNNHDLAYMSVQHYFNVIKLRMTDDFKSETCDRIGVRVLDRLLRDNPFTYLPSQTVPAQMGKRREEV